MRDVLVKLGVAPERLFAVGMGERFPLTMGQSADERARNRRAEFYILLRDDELMHAVRPEYVAEIAKRTGQPTWPLEAAVGRDTLGRDAAAGRAALERAIDGAPGIAERLTIFDAPVIAALPERYRALVREAALAQIPPPASAAEPYWTTLVALPAGASGPDGAAEQAAIEKTLGLLLAPLADPAARWQAPAWQISASADALERLGRHDEAARRRSELAEKSAPR
ncbi:MAG: hypothetical protein U1F43_38435 [Myxococcota bacterium]